VTWGSSSAHRRPRHQRPVLATALACGAEVIVTENVRDFPTSALEPHGIEAWPLEHFLLSFDPATLRAAIDSISTRSRNPTQTTEEILTSLSRTHGLKRLAQHIQTD
jgi:hypothetical protein